MAALLDDHPGLSVFSEEYLYVELRETLGARVRGVLRVLFKEKVLLPQAKLDWLWGYC